MNINPWVPDFIMEESQNVSQAMVSNALGESTKNRDLGADMMVSDASNGFDCNICLDISRDPVVTLCGHLYCWPCIYKWLQSHSSSQQCPVCKGTISQTTLVPLYGRGQDAPQSRSEGKGAHPNLDIPDRPPSVYTRAHSLATETTTTLNELSNPGQHRHPHHHHHHHPYFYDDHMSAPPPAFDLMMTRVIHPVDGSLGELAMAILPWLLGNRNVGLYYPNSFDLMGDGNNPWVRHQEQQAGRLLSRILAFLTCFAVLCFLVF